MSGKELFAFNASLFVDDDGAINEDDENEMSGDRQKLLELEERRAKEEMERVRAEQERLAEIHRIELEYRMKKEDDRRVAAAAKDRVTFTLNGIVINQVVFEDDEEEDLAPFREETLVEIEKSIADLNGFHSGEQNCNEENGEDKESYKDDNPETVDDT